MLTCVKLFHHDGTFFRAGSIYSTFSFGFAFTNHSFLLVAFQIAKSCSFLDCLFFHAIKCFGILAPGFDGGLSSCTTLATIAVTTSTECLKSARFCPTLGRSPHRSESYGRHRLHRKTTSEWILKLARASTVYRSLTAFTQQPVVLRSSVPLLAS